MYLGEGALNDALAHHGFAQVQERFVIDLQRGDSVVACAPIAEGRSVYTGRVCTLMSMSRRDT